jgi:S-adenosylmethionine decarboxylase proenzyme
MYFEKINHRSLGSHLLVDFQDCDSSILDDLEQIRAILLEAVNLANGTIVTHVFHRFAPQGVSGVIVIAESHVAIHTWPEYRCAAIDIFSCSESLSAHQIYEHVRVKVSAQNIVLNEMKRGSRPLQV